MFCTKCGSENEQGAKICGDCGSALIGNDMKNMNSNAQKNSKRRKAAADLPPMPAKGKKGRLFGLVGANVLLIAAAVVFIVMITTTASAQGLWYSEDEGDVLAFSNDGRVVLYERDSQLGGSYEYSKGSGTFTISGAEFTYDINGGVMIINQTYEYRRVSDKDFDITAFVGNHTVAGNVDTGVTATPAPTQTAVPNTPNPAPTQNGDAVLAQNLVLNTWYGYFIHPNEGSDVTKTDSDIYEFFEDGTFIYQYAGNGDRLFGPWEIKDGRLTVVYENSEIGTVSWDIQITYEDGYAILVLADTRPGYEGGYWIYTDTPADEIEESV